MPRKQTLRLKTRARLLAEQNDSAAPAAVAQKVSASPLQDDLRLLYERSSLTVRAIAKLAGISERMLYKYAEQGRWADRETRVSRKVTLLDPGQSERIVTRAKQTVRLSDEAAATEITRVKAQRDACQSGRALDQNMRVYEMLAGALAETASGSRVEAQGLSCDLQQLIVRLILRQMQAAFENALSPVS
jgi:hypothetical protein